MSATERSKERVTLDDFALKGNHLAKMTGISVGVHAIEDAFLLMHVGVGCKYKGAAQIGPHDWATHPNRKEGWTQVGEVQLIKGSSVRIGPFARTWYERRRPAFMPVVSAYFIELTGEDCSDVIARTEATVPCDMAMLKTQGPNGGYYEGYAELTLEVTKKVDWTVTPTPGTAGIVGYYFDRYEADHQGDLSQVRSLLKVCGLTPGSILLSGASYAEHKRINESETILSMPYLGKKARRFKRVSKRKPVDVDLPMGMAGTAAFLRTVGAATGANMRRVEAWIEAQEAQTKAKLDMLSAHSRNLSVALFADSPLAAGIYAILHEANIEVPIIGFRENWLGGKTNFLATLERWGVPTPTNSEMVNQPSLRWTRETVGKAIRHNRVHGIIGSAHETNMFRRPQASASDEGVFRSFSIDVGFPADHRHVSVPLPQFGYVGALAFTQRIYDMYLRAV